MGIIIGLPSIKKEFRKIGITNVSYDPNFLVNGKLDSKASDRLAERKWI
jgi:hypothetical protein